MTKSLNAQPLTEQQVEKIRLLLSTYQDGTGQFVIPKGPFKGSTLPNWRDFERSVAVTMQGRGTENKSLFDVVVRSRGSNTYGISCKMRKELGSANKKGVIYLEVSNAAGEFWDVLREIGIGTTTDMVDRADEAGKAIIELVERWAENSKRLDAISLDESYYLVLLWDDKSVSFQLFQLGLDLPAPEDLSWHVRLSKKTEGSGCLVGSVGERVLIEWYGNAGGQLKYYPLVEQALWKSEPFQLEALPFSESGYGIEQKAKTFFPEQWEDASK